FFLPGCAATDIILASQSAGASGFLLVFNEPWAPDEAPPLLGADPAVTLPGFIISYNTATAFDAALASGTVSVSMSVLKAQTDLDGSIDNAIVAHEWGHYLTNRLVGNGSGLTTKQSNALGEGWGDFISMLLMVRAEDASHPNGADWSGAYAMGSYATRVFTGKSASYFGIRRVPYSTDRAKNALTFKHVDDSQPLPTSAPMQFNPGENSQVHNAGEVWATALWEVYVSLLRVHPFEEAQ